MDPELMKYIDKARAAGASDAKIANVLFEKYGIKWEPEITSNKGKQGFLNRGRSAYQGATFNYGDELLGLLPEWMGGGEKNRDEFRERDEAYKRAHPVVSTLGEVAGGFVVPGFGAGRALGGAMNIKRAIGAGAAVGAASGALAGSGAAEGGPAERAKGAVIPGAIGGVVGAALPGAFAAGRSLYSPAARAAARLSRAVDRSGGPEGVIASSQVNDELGRGAEQILADQSRPLQQAADYAANNSEEAYEAIEGVVEPRARDMNQRVLNDVQARVGDPNAEKIAERLRDRRLEWADGPEGFEGLRQRNPAVIPAMGNRFHALLQQPHVRDALAQAREVGLIGDESLGVPKDGSVSYAVLQGTKERLDAITGRAFATPGLRDLGAKMKKLKGELIGLMREGVDGYGAVADKYDKMHSLEEMLEHGRQTYNEPDSRGLRELISTLDPAEKKAFRAGLVSELIVDLRRKASGQNAARQMVRMSPRHKDVMEVAFDSQHELQRFMAEMSVEDDFTRTGGSLLGSQTHRRGAAVLDPAAIATDVATVGPTATAVGAARSMLPKWLGGKTAREMGPVLATQGTQNIQELMRQWQRQPQDLLGEMAARRVPLAGGLLGQEMFGD